MQIVKDSGIRRLLKVRVEEIGVRSLAISDHDLAIAHKTIKKGEIIWFLYLSCWIDVSGL